MQDNIYIGHYKSVNSASEFYSKARATLDYPAQVERDKERYTLYATYIIPNPTQLKNFKNRLNILSIDTDVDLEDK